MSTKNLLVVKVHLKKWFKIKSKTKIHLKIYNKIKTAIATLKILKKSWKYVQILYTLIKKNESIEQICLFFFKEYV